MTKITLSAFLLALCIATSCAHQSQLHDPRRSTAVAGIVEPGGTPEDSKLAVSNPDQYAWELFAYLVRQAKPGTAGVADPAELPFHEEDDTDGVWETWALASSSSAEVGENESEVFHFDGSRPMPWDGLSRSQKSQKFFSPGLTATPVAEPGPSSRQVVFGQVPPDPFSNNQEVRMNYASFDTIVQNHLYSKEGIESAIASARQRNEVSFATFPGAAKEIKAAWIRMRQCESNPTCADKARYHWRTVKLGASTEIWGLAALHIMTKDLNNWFWADFTHVDCENKVGACANYATGYMDQSSDSTSADAKPKSDTYGTRWQNYHLRGTENGFLKNGQDAVLSNPVIETFKNPTSCMTCHAYASAGAMGAASARTSDPGAPLPSAGISPTVGLPVVTSTYLPAGVQRPSADPTNLVYLQSDFEWSMTKRAKSEVTNAAPAVHHPANQRSKPPLLHGSSTAALSHFQ